MPIERGKRRPGTTLQLDVTRGAPRALVHLDGERGGAFRWIDVRAFAPSAAAAAAAAALPAPSPLAPVPIMLVAVPMPAASVAAQARTAVRQRGKEVQMAHAERLEAAASQRREVAKVQARIVAKTKKDREDAATEREGLVTTVDALSPSAAPGGSEVVGEKPWKRLRRGTFEPVVGAAVQAAGAVSGEDVDEKEEGGDRVGTAVRSSFVIVPMASPEPATPVGDVCREGDG